jgi:hypothetical protein
MAEQEKQPREAKQQKKKQVRLPFCRKAPSPEMERGTDDDEPCDDYRDGSLDLRRSEA